MGRTTGLVMLSYQNLKLVTSFPWTEQSLPEHWHLTRTVTWFLKNPSADKSYYKFAYDPRGGGRRLLFPVSWIPGDHFRRQFQQVAREQHLRDQQDVQGISFQRSKLPSSFQFDKSKKWNASSKKEPALLDFRALILKMAIFFLACGPVY